MEQQKWIAIAKNAGIVLAIIVAATQLWDWITEPEDELVAYVEFAPFIQPPQLHALFESLAELQEREKLASLIDLDSILEGVDAAEARSASRETLSRISWLLRERLPTTLPFEFRLRGIWIVRVANDSSRSLADVTISLPHTRFISVTREGNDPVSRQSGDVVALGAMRPRESISLVAWAEHDASTYYAEQIKLTHAQGVGDTIVRAPVGPMAQWIDKYWFLLLMFFFWVAFMGLLFGTQALSRSRNAPPGQPSEPLGSETEPESAA